MKSIYYSYHDVFSVKYHKQSLFYFFHRALAVIKRTCYIKMTCDWRYAMSMFTALLQTERNKESCTPWGVAIQRTDKQVTQ